MHACMLDGLLFSFVFNRDWIVSHYEPTGKTGCRSSAKRNGEDFDKRGMVRDSSYEGVDRNGQPLSFFFALQDKVVNLLRPCTYNE